MKLRVVAIIPAAGSGKRLGSREKKIFVRLCGKPLIAYALKALNSSGYIDNIIVAVQPSSIKRLKGIIKKYGIDPKETYFIGDDKKDILAGRKIGCKTVLVLSGKSKREDAEKWEEQPDYIFKNLLEAVKWIIKEIASGTKVPSQ